MLVDTIIPNSVPSVGVPGYTYRVPVPASPQEHPADGCPNCGYCPHCGRSDYRPFRYPRYPSYPYIGEPTWVTPQPTEYKITFSTTTAPAPSHDINGAHTKAVHASGHPRG